MKQLLEKYNCDLEKNSIWLQANPSITAKSTFFYVQETGFFKCHPDYYTERENLSSYLILLSLSGEGLLKYGGKTYSIAPRQAFFIDCMEYNYYKTTSNEHWETCWVHFKGANSYSYYSLFNKNCLPVVDIENSDHFKETIFKIIKYHKQYTQESEVNCSMLIVSLLTDLLKSSSSALTPTSNTPDYLQEVASYIEKNQLNDFSLDDLSNMFSISKFHLSREFKKYYGVTINEYHIQLRIEIAKKLLTCTQAPIREISEKIGIYNVSHFINLFKKRVRDTPLSYRKKWHHLG